MNVLVLGADGYIGTEFIMNTNHDVTAVDNYYKRELLQRLNITPLYDVPRLYERDVKLSHTDLTNYDQVKSLIKTRPDAVIHLAEQPSAPYSMKSHQTAMETVHNNLTSTLNLIYAIRDYSPDTHFIKLGTMGEYGCPNVKIPEGWFALEREGRADKLLFPKTPHSIYHLSKVFDSDALAFASRVWGLRVTDLNQGFVYGFNHSRFCYDAIFGTAINRFLTQAVIENPLTVYGRGGQQRPFIHINDSIQCLHLALEHPAERGEFKVINQLTEWKKINDLAYLVRDAAYYRGFDVSVDHIENPRIEKEDHFYEVEHSILESYGFKPTYISRELIEEMLDKVNHYRNNIDKTQIYPEVKWSSPVI